MNSTKKPKLVRDSFTIPKAEYAAIDLLKGHAMALGLATKKSELLRAGLKVLAGMGDDALRAALVSVPTLKTGRPATEPAKTLVRVPKPSAAPKAGTATSAKTTPATTAPRRSASTKPAATRQTPARKAAATKSTPSRKTANRRAAVRAVK